MGISFAQQDKVATKNILVAYIECTCSCNGIEPFISSKVVAGRAVRSEAHSHPY